MNRAFVLVPSLLAFVALAACADEDSATTNTEQGNPTVDAAADSTTSNESATDEDASSQEDGAAFDGAGPVADGDAGSTSPDSGGGREGGPGGDGGIIIGGDSAASDATFQIKSQSGTNLLSSSDVHADCTGVAGSPAGVYVVTCLEKTGSTGPCRTVTITVGTNSATGLVTGLVFTAVNKATPAVGEAVVVYQESIDCTNANTNGWTVASPGGTVSVDARGDTGMRFIMTNVPLGPSSAAGVVNQNAAGTFAVSTAGTGFTTLPFGG